MQTLSDRLLSLGMGEDDFGEMNGHRISPPIAPHPETGAWHFLGIDRTVPVALTIPIGATLALDLLPLAAIGHMRVLDHGTQGGQAMIAIADAKSGTDGRWIPLSTLTGLPDQLIVTIGNTEVGPWP